MAVGEKGADGKPRIIRPLGNMERYQFHMMQLGYLGNTIVNCRYALPASLAAPDRYHQVVAQVEDAIARVVLEHPALRLDVVHADTKRPAWVAVDVVDFAHHVQWEDVNAATEYEEFLRAKIEERLDEPSPQLDGRPQWRALILANMGEGPFLDVIFDYSHAFSDGTGGKIFHETLLRMLNTPAAQPVLTDRVLRVPSTARRLPPPIEKAAKFSLSAGYMIATSWKQLKPRGFASPQADWAPIRVTPYKTQFRMFDVAPEPLQNILTACRSHETTVTGLLQALVLMSMAAHVPPRDATTFTGSTALDLRRHVPARADLEPKRTIADYVSVTTHEYDTDLVREVRAAVASTSGADDSPASTLVELVWQCATRVRREIQKRLDLGLKNDIVGLMGLVPDWRVQHRNVATKPRSSSFVVTNLGALDGAVIKADGEESGPDGWKIEHSVFAISAEVCGAAFQVAPISVKHNALCVSCSWQDSIVDVELAEAIVADLERWFRFLGTSHVSSTKA